MSILKKENWIICLILNVITGGLYNLAIAKSLNLYDKKAWYSDYRYWFFAALCLIFPIFIFFLVFYAEMLVKVNQKLGTPGSNIYELPYTWIICIIIPVIGWVLLLTMLVYLIVWPAIMIKRG